MLLPICKACVLAFVQLAAISGTLAVTAPYFIEEPTDIFVRKGKPAELKCRVGGDPKPSIKWKRNGITLTLDSRRTIKPDGSLYISEIIHNKTQKPDEGTYQCEAVSYITLDYRVISRTARVIVAGISSKVAVTPSSLKATFGDTSRFFCSIKHSSPKAIIAWRKQGSSVLITTGERFTLTPDGALQIRNIRFEEQGKYECVARNTITMRTHTSTTAGTLQVIPDNGYQRRPRLEARPKDTVAIIGSKIVLECIANGYPKPRVAWQHDGSAVPLGSRGYSILGESNLVIHPVNVAHAGTYKCVAKALTRLEEAEAKLDVHYGPVFTRKPSNVYAYVNTDARFECKADGIPKPSIMWSRNGEEQTDSDYIIVGDGFLTVKDLVLSDIGAYQCFAKNSLGTIQATAELKVFRKGEPLPPTTPPPTTTPDPTTTVRTTLRSTTPRRRYPEKPENVVATPLSDTEIELTWSPPSVPNGKILEYTCYYAELGKDGPLSYNSVNTSGDTHRKVISNLKPDTQYQFNIFATNKHGAGSVSDEVSTRTYPSSQVPGKPRNLVAEAESDSSIRVTWAEPVTGPSSVSKYMIIYKDATSNSGEMQDDTKQQTRVLRDLKTYTKYTISVYAVNKLGLKGASAVTEATTKGGVPRVAPTEFVLKPDSSGTRLIATWKAPDPTKVNGRVTFYTINYRKVGSTDEKTTERIGSASDPTEIPLQRGPKFNTTRHHFESYLAAWPLVCDIKMYNETSGQVTWALKNQSSMIKYDSKWQCSVEFWPSLERNFSGIRCTLEAKTTADKQAYTIKSLMPSTKYEAKIAAGTESGLGEYTRNWVVASTNISNCKEDTTPGKPRLEEPEKFSNAILVRWLPPDNAGLVCVTGYSLRWGENSPFQFSSDPLSGGQTQYLIKELRPNQKYVVKLLATNRKGNGLDTQTLIQTLAETGAPEPVKSVQAIPLSSRVMRISWRDSKVSTSVPIIYHVFHSLRNQLKYCGNTTEKSIRCVQLKPRTNYMFYVRRNDERINATVKNFTMEDRPGVPTDLTGNPNEEDFTRLTLHWQPPHEPNGLILEYRILYSTNPNAPDNEWKSVKARLELTKEISGLKPGTAYWFKMQAKTKKGWGPLSKKEQFSTLTTVVTRATDSAATALTSPAPGDPNAAAQAGSGGLKNKTLWIVIAAVAGITLIAIIIISVILCKKRSGDDIQRKPPTYKQVIQSNGSAKKKHKEEKPDLWINHTDNMEMKPVESVNPAPDVTNTTALIPRSSKEMRPMEDSPLDHIHIDNERSSFLHGSEADPEDFEDLPPPPMIDSRGDPYLDYPDENRTATPPPSPGLSPFNPPSATTPENVKKPMYPMTSTPRYHTSLPRAGSCENTADVADPRPPQRSKSYDPDFYPPSSKVPVFPMVHPARPPTLPKPKSPVAPADDIQLPPVGYNRNKPPNGYWTPPPKYEDIFARRSKPPSSPPKPKEQDAVVADLDKEIAGLEGLMKDLNEITAGDYKI